MSHGEGGRSRVEGQDHVTGSECAATTTGTAAAVKVEVTVSLQVKRMREIECFYL